MPQAGNTQRDTRSSPGSFSVGRPDAPEAFLPFCGLTEQTRQQILLSTCAPASNAEPHLAPLNSLIGHNKEKLDSAKSASRGPPFWSTFSVSHSDT